MSKDCNCGGSCCTDEKSLPKLRKLIREILEKEMTSKWKIEYWYRDSDGEKDMGTKEVNAISEEKAISELLSEFPIKRKDIIKVTKL